MILVLISLGIGAVGYFTGDPILMVCGAVLLVAPAFVKGISTRALALFALAVIAVSLFVTAQLAQRGAGG